MVFLAIPPLANLGISAPVHDSNLSSAKTYDAHTYSKGDSIRVSESVTVAVNGKPYSIQSSSSDSQSGEFDNHIVTVKENSNSVTTLDKIFNFERLRFNGRTLIKYNPVTDVSYGEKLSAMGTTVVLDSGNKNDFQPTDGKFSDVLSALSSNFGLGPIFFEESGSLNNNILKLAQDQDNGKYLAVLILVPISGSVLICLTDSRIVARSKSICSFIFMIILVSSGVTTPLSISGGYIRPAFAEPDNNAKNLANSTQLNFNHYSNSTQPGSGINFGYSNSTQLNFNHYSNSTQPGSGINFGYSNSTQLNFNHYSNSTQMTTTPNATKSWDFGSVNNGTASVGEVNLQNVANSSALSLQGNGYLTENLTSTKSLSHLTLSAWVKPDYTQGSPQFTIISAEKQFVLSINNIVPPVKLATFSIFDGIKWDTVNSTIPIGGNWTNIAATFNGSSMALYVNGTIQSSLNLNNVLAIQVDGNIGTKTVGNITSNGNIVIGAYYDSVRQESINKFSGLLTHVNLYESDFTADQINEMYMQQMPLFYSTLAANVSNSTSTNSTSSNMTSIVDPSITQTQSDYLITQSPQFQFQYISDSNFTKMAHLFRHTNMTQYGRWHDNSTAINVQVVGPDGSPFLTNPTFKEIREGKFDIQLSSTRAAKPGLYNVTLTMVKNGKTYTTQEQYQWGLVSVNTQKSIYRPGEAANFTIVVLDNGGHSVCNANIAMRITDPLGSSNILTSGSGITPESQCGLYDAQYTTNSAGNYTVNITAQNPSGVAYFGTSFLAQNFYPFDITRTTASKIDPIDNPNSFNVQLDFNSYTNATNVSIQESVPSTFNVTTDANVQTVGDSKILTWNRDMVANQTSVQYNYSVPLQYPQLYALGPAQITYGNGQTFTEARPWFVAVDPSREISVNSGTSTTSPLNFAVTVPSSATHTVGVVGVIVDSASAISGINVEAGTNTACSTGTQTFTLISGSQASQGNDQIELWNFTAPSTSDTNICVSWTGTATRVDAGFIAVNGTTQGGIIRQANAAGGTGVTKTTLSLSSSVGGEDLIVDAAADLSRTNAISPTDTGHTKLWSQVTTFSAAGGSKNATGADTLQWSPLVAANTWLASAVALESPFTGITQNDTVAISDLATVTSRVFHAVSVQDSLATNLSDKIESNSLVHDSLATNLSDKIESNSLVHDSLATNLSDKIESNSLVQDTVSVTDSASTSASVLHAVSVQDSLATNLSDSASTSASVLHAVSVQDSLATNLSDKIESNSLVHDSLATNLSDKIESNSLVQDTVSVTDSASTSASVLHAVSVQDSLATNLSDSASTSASVLHAVSVQDSLATNLSDKIESNSLVHDSLATNLSDKIESNSLVQDTVSVTDSASAPAGVFHAVSAQDSLATNLSDKIESNSLVRDTVSVSDLTTYTVSRIIQLSDSLLSLTRQSP